VSGYQGDERVAASPRQSARITPTASSSRATRSGTGGNGMPSFSCSRGAPPMPIPSTSRPGAAAASVAAIEASSAGWRFMTLATSGPTVARRVRAAAIASTVHASRTGFGRPARTMKWSHAHRPR
jgi:hypothetical protein